jgi:hypothetical protein
MIFSAIQPAMMPTMIQAMIDMVCFSCLAVRGAARHRDNARPRILIHGSLTPR